MVPSVEKCISFLGLNQQGLETPEQLRLWVLKNQKTLSDKSPGQTSGCFVPFYTQNAVPCIDKFGSDFSLINTDSFFNELINMRLVYGFICSGRWGNSSYHTMISSDDFTDVEAVKSIESQNLGSKLYFLMDRANNSDKAWCPEVVVVTSNVRIESGNVVCLPLQIRTNSYSVGGHCSEIRADVSYRKFTKTEGWDTRRVWNEDCFLGARNIETEKEIHRQIIGMIKSMLC